MSFALDPRLAADGSVVLDLALSRALLMNDARFFWVILVPRRAGLVEITDLGAAERQGLMEEIAAVAATLKAWPGVEKINLGALGNLVRQLHVHVVGRSVGDAAWPGPVWGAGGAAPYEAPERQARTVWLKQRLVAQL